MGVTGSSTIKFVIASLALVAVSLAGCKTSYDEAAEEFFASNPPTPDPGPTPPPPPPPTGGSFNPVFSEVQSNVFTPTCATSGCHSGGSPAASLNLEAANSYAMLVGVASTQDSGIQRVNPGNPNLSYLIQKMEGTAATGGVMPPSGAIEQADIDVIRQWITDGAVDDTVPASTPIRVSSLSVTPNAVLTAGPTGITAGFDREPDASTINANTFLLTRANGDSTFDNGNDVAITAASISVPTANTQSALFDLTGVSLPDDLYRILLRGNGASVVLDLDANILDGEFGSGFPSGNGTEGGDFIAYFTITTPVVLEPNLDSIQAAVFTPSCATAGCHNNSDQAGSLSLQDADTSYAEMVGEFSNQTGQENVLLVAPNDPDNSYLIRKMENAAGITGQRMPPSGTLPQADIDVIRDWITNGAVR